MLNCLFANGGEIIILALGILFTYIAIYLIAAVLIAAVSIVMVEISLFILSMILNAIDNIERFCRNKINIRRANKKEKKDTEQYWKNL